MQENYHGGKSIRKLSKQELQKMKENMQKTPLIQAQAERYHRSESKEADQLLIQLEASSSSVKATSRPSKQEKIWFFQKIKNYLFWLK